MDHFRLALYRISNSANFFIYNFAQETNNTGVACGRSTYPITLYAGVNTPMIGTQFYTDETLTIPFNFPALTTYYYKRDIDGLLYPIYQDGKLIDNPISCAGGSTYGYKRDGTQDPGLPDFHVPKVEYLDLMGNPQTFFPQQFDDICGFIFASSIVNVEYAITCT